ncbi:hypothetical protein P154DRAFT_518510 [Amniculicola lignicola CBS 123094]|uniref:BTB domain-containing protein n=1 Tax=Amniculicola lignicola CBS 123094 TaxID=1392246 RepID=A0A6A5WU92_9PLEO|nr:hypothetical protein P154DRAFT_518510 [Amniculicola lignicola CBS 123094]
MTPPKLVEKGPVPTFTSTTFDLVTIRVGDPPVNIPVYKDIICTIAPYFRGAFSGDFIEAESGLITLPDVSEQTFRAFLQWAHAQMYLESPRDTIFGLFPCPKPPSSNFRPDLAAVFDENKPENRVPRETMVQDRKDVNWLKKYNRLVMVLLKLYIFADQYSVHQLRDDIMTALVANSIACGWWPDPEADIIDLAYDSLPKASTFRRFLLEPWAFFWSREEATPEALEGLKNLHSEFLVEWGMMQTKRLWSKGDGTTGKLVSNSCKYHEHRLLDDVECRKRLIWNTHIFKGLIESCREEVNRVREEAPSAPTFSLVTSHGV